jgi:hypothetical protein
MAEKKQLASHLQDEYLIDAGGKVIPKSGLKVKIDGKDVELNDPDIWVLAHTSKSNRDMYIRCTKIITHATILRLKNEHDIKFTNYEWKKEPNNSDLWGYLLVTTENGFVGDGEVHIKTLMPSMRNFPYTMLKKRAEDRAVLLELGLYGLVYSEEEITPEMKEDFEETPTPKSNVKTELLDKIERANDYLCQPKKELLELVAGLTGQEPGKVDLPNMSTDLLAKIFNTLKKMTREEYSARKELLPEFFKTHPKTKKTEEELLNVPSKRLQQAIDKKKEKE